MLCSCPIPRGLSALLALVTLAISLTAEASPAPRCIAVVGTNDLHGAIEPYRIGITDASPPNEQVSTGGVVGLSAYVQQLRTTYGDRMVLLDGGDLFQGTMASNLSRGQAVIDAYNLLGYTAAAIGNHEFDFGALPDSADKLGVLKARIAQAKFPFLTLNIFDRTTGERVQWPNTAPSILRDVGGIKVGILGVSTVETPRVTKPENVSQLQFRAPMRLVRDEARALRKRGAQLIVLVGHIGGKCKNTDNPNDISACASKNIDGELFELLQALPPGTVDVAVGGHTHQFVAHWVNGTAAIESGARGHFVGWVDACLDPNGGLDRSKSTIHAATPLCLTTFSDGECKKHKAAALPILPARFLDKPVKVMPQVETAMQPYLDAVSQQAAQPIGAKLDKRLGFGALTPLVAESMRRSTKSDFGLQNRGGIRAELPAGTVTYGQVFGVLPFDNYTVQATMTGAQVEALIKVLNGRHGGIGGPVLVGLKVRRKGDQLTITTTKGQPIDPKRRYTFATSDFIAQGGEGADAVFKELAPEDLRVTPISMRDAFIDLLKAVYPG